MIQAQGVASLVTFDGAILTVTAKRVDRVIPIAQITSIDFQEPSFLRGLGYAHFRVFGDKSAVGVGPNAFTFDKQTADDFRALAGAVRQAIAGLGNAPAPAASGAPANSDAVFEALRKLGELRDAGIVTPEEFETKKAELLSRI